MHTPESVVNDTLEVIQMNHVDDKYLNRLNPQAQRIVQKTISILGSHLKK